MKNADPLILTMLLLLNLSCQPLVYQNSEEHKVPPGYWNETFLKMAYGMGTLKLIEKKPEIPPNILEIKNIEYKKSDSLSLKLDLYRDRNLNGRAPAIVFIHGGAWKSGKREDYLPYLIDYANKGFVTITISYRLAQIAKFPAAVLDVNCAIAWIGENCDDYNIDPERIALVGGSAGGHLAMMAGYASKDPYFKEDCLSESGVNGVKVVVNLYGPADLTTEEAKIRKEPANFIGGGYWENRNLFEKASPRYFISPDLPPTLIFHGTIDSVVPVSQSDSLAYWLTKAGVPNEYHKLKGWPHTMDLAVPVNRYVQFHMDGFFRKYL